MLYDRVKKLCEEKKLSIAALEKAAGIANGTISAWGKGTPTIMTVKKVAEVLEVSIDDLVAGIDFPMTGGNE